MSERTCRWGCGATYVITYDAKARSFRTWCAACGGVMDVEHEHVVAVATTASRWWDQ